MTALIIFVGNTTVIELQDLTNTTTAEAVTNATVTVTLETPQGEDVTGQAWPLTLSHVADGTYRATIESDVAIVANRRYKATIDATVSGVGAGHWEPIITAMTRTE
jgi:hypothetical protein